MLTGSLAGRHHTFVGGCAPQNTVKSDALTISFCLQC